MESDHLVIFFDGIRLNSHETKLDFLKEKVRVTSMWLVINGSHAVQTSITEADFLAVFHTFKTEVNDELNILGIGEVKTPHEDQSSGAGTNNFEKA